MVRISAFVLFFLLFSCKVWSQAAVSTQAFAEVIAALTATETAQLHFGKFSPEINGGQVILSPDGVRSVQGSVILGGGSSSPGRFYITGEPEATFSVQLPNGPIELINQTTNQTMQVNDWVSDPPAGTGTGVLAGGSDIVSVGATLYVSSMQDNPVGIYTGTFSLTFAYN
jgi:hypothetical protein